MDSHERDKPYSSESESEIKFPDHKTEKESENVESEDEEKEDEYENRYNTRALSQDAETYELETFENNLMIIINNKMSIDGDRSEGVDKDVESLKNTFSKFGFSIEEIKDFTKTDILSELDKLTTQDLSDYGCVIVTILTYCETEGELKAKGDESYKETDILKRLKVTANSTLITKPKIILIRAPIWNKDVTIELTARLNLGSVVPNSTDGKQPYNLPAESDVLIYTCDGSNYSSGFIQTLCNNIDDFAATEHLLDILNRVNRDVAIDIGGELLTEIDGQSIVARNEKEPVKHSTLIRKLYLKKYIGSASASPSNRHDDSIKTEEFEENQSLSEKKETESDARTNDENMTSVAPPTEHEEEEDA